MSRLYYAAACQTDFPCAQDRSEIPDRVRRMCEIAEQTVLGYEPFFARADIENHPLTGEGYTGTHHRRQAAQTSLSMLF